jgi:Flp pilus assembly CpaE family ATPase
LTDDALGELGRRRIPLVVLAPAADLDRWRRLAAVVLPVDAEPAAVREALESALRGGALPVAADHGQPTELPAPARDAVAATVLAVAGGHGGPGRTTTAVNLAAALGAVAPTVLVDADLCAPSACAYLDLDPTHNLYMLAHTAPETSGEWSRALAEEAQALGDRARYAVALCGVPKPALRAHLTERFFDRLLGELRRRHRYVVVDVGAELSLPDLGLHRAALRSADQVLLVGGADLVGLWHTRRALGALKDAGVPAERTALIVNRHDRRYHHGAQEIGWALGVPVAAVIPNDHHAAQRAVAAQRPLVLDGASPAGRAFVDLAERVHGGRVVVAPDSAPRRSGLTRLVGSVGRLRRRPTETEKMARGDAVVSA